MLLCLFTFYRLILVPCSANLVFDYQVVVEAFISGPVYLVLCKLLVTLQNSPALGIVFFYDFGEII